MNPIMANHLLEKLRTALLVARGNSDPLRRRAALSWSLGLPDQHLRLPLPKRLLPPSRDALISHYPCNIASMCPVRSSGFVVGAKRFTTC